MRTVIAIIVAALGAGGASAAAHDLWLEPTAFVSRTGTVVGIRLRVGQDLVGDPVPRDPAAIDQFIVLDGAGPRAIPGRDGGDPAGLLRVESDGLLVVGYRSRPSAVTLPAEKFNQYLKEEGLETIAAARARRQETRAGGRELFSRAAKSLVLAGPLRPTQRDRVLGFRLELVAGENPYALAIGQELPVRILYEHRPLRGALVVAVNKSDPSAKLTARSDAEGRVRFRLTRSGMWLIKAVHMVPAPAGSKADWESVWASLTFELTPTSPAVPGR
jgi:uncharacterized GH25 family protein